MKRICNTVKTIDLRDVLISNELLSNHNLVNVYSFSIFDNHSGKCFTSHCSDTYCPRNLVHFYIANRYIKMTLFLDIQNDAFAFNELISVCSGGWNNQGGWNGGEEGWNNGGEGWNNGGEGWNNGGEWNGGGGGEWNGFGGWNNEGQWAEGGGRWTNRKRKGEGQGPDWNGAGEMLLLLFTMLPL